MDIVYRSVACTAPESDFIISEFCGDFNMWQKVWQGYFAILKIIDRIFTKKSIRKTCPLA
ncbi:hypothetical protein DW091_01265 [Eubacterium sp. AM05-23]|nr:hypothetical protein DW091_01265 [Eubacterium sp. AM05-23]